MSLEKRWGDIAPRLFTTNGTAGGRITLTDTIFFKVKQKVAISATGLPNLELEVKAVLSNTTLIVGPLNGNIYSKTNLSAYTLAAGAFIYAAEQTRSEIPLIEHYRATFEEEPTNARRSVLVDPYGDFYTLENPIPSQVNVDIDGVYTVENPDPDNSGLIAHQRNINPNDTHQTERITSIAKDNVRALDVSLHDDLGSPYTPFNPLDVRISGINPNTISKNIYDEKPAIPMGVETLIVSYLMPLGKFGYLLRAEFSGAQFSHYYVYIDGIKQASKRSSFDLSGEFPFIGGTVDGILIEAGDLIELTTIHSSVGAQPFEGRLQIAEGYISPANINILLQENDDYILQENGDYIYF